VATDRANPTASFTVGVFKDLEWATRAVEALERQGFPPTMLSVFAKDTPEAATFIEARLGTAPERMAVPRLGALLAAGPLVEALNGGDEGLSRAGLAGTMRRAGFQAHDAQIYETLTERGGVLVAVHDDPRAADALSVFLSHGGGNAAIGAWRGRV
jgi:hypothetical protein